CARGINYYGSSYFDYW
nr:immunoglobulin heavy chain junction region [Mus musculus]